MKVKILAALLVLAAAPNFFGQTVTNLTATVQDSQSVLWANGPYTVTFIGSGAGTPYTKQGQAFTQQFSGTLNGSGQLSITVTDVNNIIPANSNWKICVTPAVSSPTTYCVTLPVTGASYSASLAINAIIQPPAVTGLGLASGYSDLEVNSLPGTMYYNVTSNTFRCFTTAWGGCAGSGGGGTVTSVAGTTNQIDVASGATTPVISLDSAITFPGTVTGVGATGGPPIAGGINATQYLLNGVALPTQTSVSGLNNVLNYAPKVTISDGSAHTVGTAPVGSPFNGVTTLAGLAAISINGTTPFSWITASPFSNGGVYVIGIQNPGSGGTAGSFSLSFTGGGCGTEPTGTFVVGAASLSIGAGTVTSVSLTTRGSGCTSAPTVSTAASSGLTSASVVATYIGDSTVTSLDIGWLAIQAALETGKTYIPAGKYVIGSALATPLYILPAAINTGVIVGTPSQTIGDGYFVTQLIAGSDFGGGVPLLAAGDPSGTAGNTLGRYATNGTEDYEGQFESIGIISSASNFYPSVGVVPVNMDGFAWGARLRTKDIDVAGFNHDWTLVGDHTEFIRPHADGGAIGFEFSTPNSVIAGDLQFLDAMVSGQSIASFSVAPTANIAATFDGETYLSAPYAILGESSPSCTAIMNGVTITHLMTEFIGNSFITDDTGYNGTSGTYTDTNKCRSVIGLSIGYWYSSYNNSHFWAAVGRARRASIDVYSAAMTIDNLNPSAGNFSPNTSPAAPSGGAPIATFNLQSITGNGAYAIRIAGNLNYWLGTTDSNTLPAFPNTVIINSQAGVILQDTGLWSGAMRGWSTPSGNYTTTVLGDVFESNGSNSAPGGTGQANSQVVGIVMQGGLTTAGALPLAQIGQAAANKGQQNSVTNGEWKLGTGIGPTLTITAAGTGGTPGSYTWTASGGSCSTEPAGGFTDTGGSITATTITTVGVGCTSGPTISTSADTGLSGATLTPLWPSAMAVPATALTDASLLGPSLADTGSLPNKREVLWLQLGTGGGLSTSTNLTLASLTTTGPVTIGNDVLNFGSNSTIYSPTSGVLRFTNNATTSFTRLDLGGTTSSFVALCSATTVLTICGGDGSAVGSLVVPTTIGVGVSGTTTGTLTLNSSTATGGITLTPASAASVFTVTIPAATDTLVNLAGTQTLTNKSVALSEVNSGYTAGGIMGASSTTAASMSTYTANGIPKMASTATTPTVSSMIDNGTTVTSTDTGGFVAPVLIANGTTAGFMDFTQGTTSAAVAPCNVANSICWMAPTSVTSQLRVLASSPATGFPLYTNSSGTMTETITGTQGTLSAGPFTFGGSAVNTVIAQTIATYAGHFTNLVMTASLGGTCTTAPTFNVFDGTSNTGTAKLATSTTQTKGTTTNQSQTLTFAAGDLIGIYISTAGGTCTLDTWAVEAQYSEP